MVELVLRESDALSLNLPDVAKDVVGPEFVRAYLDATVMAKVRREYSWLDWEVEVERGVDGFIVRIVAIRRMRASELEYKMERTVGSLMEGLKRDLKGALELVKKELAVLKRLLVFRALELKEVGA